VRTLRPRIRFTALAGGLVAAGVVALLALAPAGIASAHDALESSSPAANDSITSDPGQVSLTFSDALITIGDDTSGFAVQVVDSDGLHYESGCLTVQGTTVTTPVALGLASGYVVLWQVVSSDGHPTSGQYEFDYAPPSPDGAHDGLTNAPACGQPWAGEPNGSPTPTAALAPTPLATAATPVPTAVSTEVTLTSTDAPGPAGAANLPWPVVVLLGVVGLGVIAAVVVLVLRRSRGGGYGGE
jgi:methionine-rich copper-binding protein CopC